MKQKILILCTGNSSRSQMAAGYLRTINTDLEVYSAGVNPARRVNPLAITAMKNIQIDISDQVPTDVDKYIDESFDFVITVCDHAREACPHFNGFVNQRLHFGFEDPDAIKGDDLDKLKEFLRIRDQITDKFLKFSNMYIHGEL